MFFDDRWRTQHLNGILPVEFFAGQFRPGSYTVIRRVPYTHGIRHKKYGYTFFWGGQQSILVEFSGTSVSQFDVNQYLASLLSGQKNTVVCKFNKVTRIDVCNDYHTSVTPYEYVTRVGINERIKTRNVIDSKTGQTFYVGSRNSTRQCRVYRYHPPHPRHETMRIEFEFHKDVGSKIAEQILLPGGLETVFDTAMANTFVNVETFDASATITPPHDRKSGNTVQWFYTQVAPALAKLIDSGEIDYTSIVEHIETLRGK